MTFDAMRRRCALFLGAGLLSASAALGALYNWTGIGVMGDVAHDNCNDEHNWIKFSGEGHSQWPSHGTDIVTIDDVTPEDEVEQNVADHDILQLLLGDGHTLNLTKGMLVKRVLECEGVVKLKGNGTLEVGSDENAI
ncbi:MAG: hypothetical protein IT449_00680, partial [Phycisphaerales bacterium]|nr:hypothetical protein [Phycisphaerales bacterium]